METEKRREELVVLDLGQVEPNVSGELRAARRVRVRGVTGQGMDRAQRVPL